jgi:mono/diheme cytochrome c family protein
MLLGFALTSFVLASLGATPQTAPKTQQKTKDQLEQLTYSVKGPDLFRAHCAACHGSGAKGDGPLASALKTKVPDLTGLAKNNAGQFPSARVRKIITGDDVLASHGSREMPIWGPIFHQIESDQDFGYVRLQNLTKYLESIQEK